jgi:hypothetical protein
LHGLCHPCCACMLTLLQWHRHRCAHASIARVALVVSCSAGVFTLVMMMCCPCCAGDFAGDGQHINVPKHFVCRKQFEVACCLNHDVDLIVMTSFWIHKWPRNYQIWAKECGCICVRLVLFPYGHYINMIKHFVYVQYGCGKQFEVAGRLNYDAMT